MTDGNFLRGQVRAVAFIAAALCYLPCCHSDLKTDREDTERIAQCKTDLFIREIQQIATGIPDQPQRDYVLGELAELQAKAGDFIGALQTVAFVQEQNAREFELQKIAVVQAESGDFRGARETAAKLTRPDGDTLLQIAMAQARRGDVQGALQSVADLGSDARDAILGILASSQVKSGNISAALATATSLKDKDGILYEVAIEQAKHGEVQEALKTSARIQDPGMRSDLAGYIASIRAGAGDFAGALRLAGGLHNWNRVSVLREIGEAQAKAGKQLEASSTFERAIRAAMTIRDVDSESSLLARVAASQLLAGLPPTALTQLAKFEEVKVKERAFFDLASEERRGGDLQNALRFFERSRDPRAIALVKGELGDVDGALAALRAEPNPADVSYSIAQIAIIRAERGDIGGALKLASIIRTRNMDSDEGYLADALRKTARAQVKMGDLAGALAWAKAQDSPYVRADSLLGVAEGIRDFCRSKSK